MRTIVHERHVSSDVLTLADVERPVPKADEVLIDVRATTISTDRNSRGAKPCFVSVFSRVTSPDAEDPHNEAAHVSPVVQD